MAQLPFISDKKRAQMIQGASLYLKWYDDLIKQGMQYLEQQPGLFESIAKQLVDTGNGSMARQIRIAADGLSSTMPQEWIAILSDQAIIARCLTRLDEFPPVEQLDILHLTGLQQRKKELKGQKFIEDSWTVLGIQIQKLEQLTERKVYLQSQSKGKIALLLDYAFRTKIFDQKWRVGSVYNIKLQFFPSAVPLRAKVESRKRLYSKSNWKGIQGLDTWQKFRQQQFNAHPWLFAYPAVLKQLNIQKSEGAWIIRDKDSSYYLGIQEKEDALRLMSYSQGEPFHCFGVWDKGSFEILSLLEEDQIIALQESIWTR